MIDTRLLVLVVFRETIALETDRSGCSAQIRAFMNIRGAKKKKKEKRNGKTILSLAEYCSKYRTSNVLNVFLYYTHSVEFSNLGISHTRIKITRSVTPDARSPSEKP